VHLKARHLATLALASIVLGSACTGDADQPNAAHPTFLYPATSVPHGSTPDASSGSSTLPGGGGSPPSEPLDVSLTGTECEQLTSAIEAPSTRLVPGLVTDDDVATLERELAALQDQIPASLTDSASTWSNALIELAVEYQRFTGSLTDPSTWDPGWRTRTEAILSDPQVVAAVEQLRRAAASC
jgi:hypothetical protein